MYPTLFHIGSTAIPSYGVFITSGYIIGILVTLYLSKKKSLPLIEIASLLLFLVIVCEIGGRAYPLVFNLIKNFSYYLQFPKEIFTMPKGGRAFYGGLIAGILFSIWYLNKFNLGFWKVGDVAGPGAALGHSIGKIGCFLGGCCYGRPSTAAWAVTFPHQSQSVHPTQLYESGLNFFSFLFLFVLLKKKKFDGQIFCFYIINCSFIRFFVEFFRGDPGRGQVFQGSSVYISLSIPQLISLIGLFIGIAFYTNLRKRKNE